MAEGTNAEDRHQRSASAAEINRDVAPKIVEGRIKWFDPARGFGFVRSEKMNCDILLHANVLNEFGQSSISSGSFVKIRIQEGARGLQATEIMSMEAPKPEELADTGRDLTDLTGPIDASLPYLPARVKWFDPTKGFGFANAFREDGDIFLHSSVLRRFGLDNMTTGEAICLRVVDGENGRVAVEVRRWNSMPSSVATIDATSVSCGP